MKTFRKNKNIQSKVFRARLRNEPTPQEHKLWQYLKNKQLGFKFRRQHGIGKYIVDFYCPEKKLVVEVDGSIHMDQEDYDEERSKYLESEGLRVLRFWNNEINKSTESVIMVISDELLK
ncbi:MAG: hypothetical protein QG551_462 [Patescibacteria group bacterium]|nr:hypothetical protein [Patescibacteria group bacterium]